MSKVYVALQLMPYEGEEVVGIFITREAAEKHCKEGKEYDSSRNFEIEEHELIGENNE